MEEIYSYVLYSLLAYTVALLVSQDFLGEVQRIKDVSIVQSLFLLASGGVSGLLGGVVTGIARRGDWLGKTFGLLRLNTLHPYDTGWDQAFSRRRGCLLRVTFKDGTNRYGIYGKRSLASTSPDERDVFLEEAYFDAPSGEVRREMASVGFWLSASEAECIRFYDLEEFASHGSEQELEQLGKQIENNGQRGSQACIEPANAIGEERDDLEGTQALDVADTPSETDSQSNESS